MTADQLRDRLIERAIRLRFAAADAQALAPLRARLARGEAAAEPGHP
jgi:hypothetical protein